ncbi:phylloplanin-like [Actinidia eriantha]|uniref:phylloplanin-like n=1 Tax=Actinidia eriantha TaxID=165200 RepID=UPI0025901C7B|nr:phylloplanin-like [Actinidia eriantha]
MAIKSSLVLVCCFLIIAVMAGSVAKAQLGLGGLLGLIRIQGVVYCTANGNIGVNGTATPAFPNALVQLQCGNGNVVSSSTTNASGLFSIVVDPVQMLLSALVSNCNITVRTPLSSCNASLPSIGGLISTLQVIGSTVLGLLTITNIIPGGFQFLSNL